MSRSSVTDKRDGSAYGRAPLPNTKFLFASEVEGSEWLTMYVFHIPASKAARDALISLLCAFSRADRKGKTTISVGRHLSFYSTIAGAAQKLKGSLLIRVPQFFIGGEDRQ